MFLKMLITVSLFLISSLAWGQHPLQGVWISDISYQDMINEMRIDTQEITYISIFKDSIDTRKDKIVQFMPMINDTGKIIVGTIENNTIVFKINYFFGLTKNQVKVYEGITRYNNVEDAINAANQPEEIGYPHRYFTQEYGKIYAQRPIFPEPDKKQLLSILKMLNKKMRKAINSNLKLDIDEFMTAWIEEQGYHDSASRMVFSAVFLKYREDKEIGEKLNEYIQKRWALKLLNEDE